MRTLEQIEAEIKSYLGFIPPFFGPAQQYPQILENLWQQTLSAYLQNPLPEVFKEKLSAYLSRFCTVSYCMICHSCTLRPLGVKAHDVLTLLESAPPSSAEIVLHLLYLQQHLQGEPTGMTFTEEVEASLLHCSIFVFLEPEQAEFCRCELRRFLGDESYQYLVALLAYIKTCHTWIESHPEVVYETDQRVQDHFAPLLAEEPALAEFFSHYRQRIEQERENQLARLQQELRQRQQIEAFLLDNNDALEHLVTQRTEELAQTNQHLRAEIAERQQTEIVFQKEQEFLQVLLDNVQAGIAACDADGILTLFNHAARNFHGLPEQPLPPESWAEYYDLYLPDGKTRMAQSEIPLFRALQGQRVQDVEMMIIPKQGTPRTLVANGRAIVNAAGQKQGAVVVMHDITDRKRAEAERIQRLKAEADQRRSEFLVKLSTTLAASLEYEQTLASVANLVVPDFADWCVVDLNQDQSIERVAVAHRDPDKVHLGWEMHRRYPKSLQAEEGLPRILRTGQGEMLAEVSDEALALSAQDAEHLNLLRQLGLRSCIISPLVGRDRVLGAITFVTAESERHYTASDFALAEEIAHRAAIAIDNASLYQEAQRLQQAAEHTADRILRLQSVTAALSESLTPDQVAEVIVEQGMTALGASSALVALVNESGTELEIVRVLGYKRNLVEDWRRFSIDAPVPLAEAVRTQKPIWAEATEQRTARYPHLAEVYAHYRFGAWISLPLVFEGQAVGGMTLGFNEPQQFQPEDQTFILTVAQQCAQAIARAHLYEAERAARTVAEEANRIKDEFLAVLSHELRTPLNPILGWARLLKERRLDDLKTTVAIETIERNAKLQAQLIEDLLDISRVLQGKLHLNVAPVPLDATIAAAIETVRLSAEAKSIQIQTQISASMKFVLGDAGRLQQVIWNLLANAVKFTPAGGQIEISLEQLEERPETSRSLWAVGSGQEPVGQGHELEHEEEKVQNQERQVENSGPTACCLPFTVPIAQITVRDSGRGIDPGFVAHVFDTFRQADSTTTRQFGGLGLGLSIVRHLVELHGGRVQVKSAGIDQGATFVVQLPLMTAAPDQNLPMAATAAPSLKGLQILAIDDEPDNLELLTFMLEQQGAIATAMSSAQAALSEVAQRSFDLLVCDISMPDLDGYQFIRQLRQRSPQRGGQIPAIALTAYAGEYNQQQALAAGFQTHLAKPMDLTALVQAIVELVGQAKSK